jgi:hypothetical protein
MKKIFLLGLIAIGVGASATSARAGGFSFNVTIGRPCPPIFVPAAPPVLLPPPVVYGGCPTPVVIRRDERVCFEPRRFEERRHAEHGRFERFERDRHDRF